MHKKPTLRTNQWMSWRSLAVVALVALMLAVSYFGTLGARTASVTLPMERVPLTATAAPGEAEHSAGAPEATGAPAPAAPEATAAGTSFDAYRETLAKSRETAGMLLNEVIADASAGADTVQAAIRQKAELARTLEAEAAIETLLKARGFGEVLCTVRQGSVNVVVKTGGLTQQQAAQIMDIAMSESGEPAANVRIIPAQ